MFNTLVVVQRQLMSDEVRQDYYLILPIDGPESSWPVFERGALLVAQQVSDIHYEFAYAISGAFDSIGQLERREISWNVLVSAAPENADGLQVSAALERTGTAGTSLLMRRFELAVSRLGVSLVPMRREIDAASNGIEIVRPLMDLLAEAFEYAHLSGVTTLKAEDVTVYELVRAPLLRAGQKINDLLERFAAVERTVERALVLGRQEGIERQQATQKRLTLVVALLAALAAFPILIGQDEFASVRSTLLTLPDPWSRVAEVLTTLHPFLTLVSVVVAALFLLALVLAAWSTAPPLRLRRGVRISKSEPPEQLIDIAWRSISDAQGVSSPSRTMKLDSEASKALALGWDAAFAKSPPGAASSAQLEQRVNRFCGVVELLKCPRRVPLKHSLVLLRHLSLNSSFALGLLSEDDFNTNLELNGYDKALSSAMAELVLGPYTTAMQFLELTQSQLS
jgi:hypothetical protein